MKICSTYKGKGSVLIAPGVPGIRPNAEDIYGVCPDCFGTGSGVVSKDYEYLITKKKCPDDGRSCPAIDEILSQQKRIDDADICIRAMYDVLQEISERCGKENNEFIPSQIVGAMFGAKEWMNGNYGHFEDIKEEYDQRLETIIDMSKQITELKKTNQRVANLEKRMDTISQAIADIDSSLYRQNRNL